MTHFVIEHQCPQCGAPAELEETDRMFQCPFCRVTSYLTTHDFFRYLLPHKAPAGKAIFYLPYWRLKGMQFSCTPKGIRNRFLDVSHQAIRSKHFPLNIGFRGQTQTLRFASNETEGIFIRPDTSLGDALRSWGKQHSAGLPRPILHQDYIGETKSLIYAPFYFGKQVIDAILNQPLPGATVSEIPDGLLQADTPNWPITFLATLCPQCGWDLGGSKDALALHCGNCSTVWHARNGRLEQLSAAHVPDGGKDAVYLPFWRIKAHISNIELATYADLIKAANLPRVVQSGWDQIPFAFRCPAFKMPPMRFLNVSTKMTLSMPEEQITKGPPKGRHQAVNLPLQEAVESLKLILADFLKPKALMVEHLPSIEITPRSALLIYLPFEETPHELVHHSLKLGISKNMLAQARNL
jgi:predicted RNA-binding Zn-ribbon protein involved in translation (DUF1610 family)